MLNLKKPNILNPVQLKPGYDKLEVFKVNIVERGYNFILTYSG